ncbi:MAG: DUF1610 domain-containing protein [Archaeoglobaceae archaeon]|nr:DUF1610 domain-containing protein [Archaeoglobaceae archaeon]HDD36531.1 DUF1610 domain-containing protein [Archaeoglobus veneficus]
MDIHKCISCGANLIGANYVKFPCPECGEIIYRCKKCRKLANPYKCENCGFEGP